MQKYLGLIILSLLLLGAPMGTARATDLYVVQGVQVDATAATAAKARDQAIHDASHKAFETLAKQIFPNRKPPKISDATLGNMVSDFHVEQEQATANRYVATFTFRFRQIPLRAAFGTGAIIPTPKELADRLQNPNAVGSDVVEDPATIDQIVSAESQPLVDNTVAHPARLIPSGINSILVQVPAHDGRELDQAMDKFRDVDAVESIEYVSITPDKSILRLSFAEPQQMLLDQMQSHGVSLRADASTQPPLYIMVQ